MKLTFLGTGSTARIPLFGCKCAACEAARESGIARNPASILVESGETRLLVDAGIHNLGQLFEPGDFTAILLTHYHVDHVQGLFDLRWGVGDPISVLGPDDPQGCADLHQNPGILDFSIKTEGFKGFSLGELMVVPVSLVHSRLTLGYGIDDGTTKVAYITDTCGLSEEAERFLMDWRPDITILDCTFPPEQFPVNHNSLDMVCEIVQTHHLENVHLTHISHELDAWLMANDLPEGLTLARDGDVIE